MTPEEKESVNKLAENLKKQGIASSMSDAVRQAKQMLGVDDLVPQSAAHTAQDIINSSEELPPEPEKPKDEQKELEKNFDVTKSEKTVKELMVEEKKEAEAVENIQDAVQEIEKAEERVEQEEEKDNQEVEKVEQEIQEEQKEDAEIKEDIKEEEQREETEARVEAGEGPQEEAEREEEQPAETEVQEETEAPAEPETQPDSEPKGLSEKEKEDTDLSKIFNFGSK